MNKILLILFVISFYQIQCQNTNIIPSPTKFEKTNKKISLSRQTSIFSLQSNTLNEIIIFNQYLQEYYGFRLPITKNKPETSHIEIYSSELFAEESYIIEMSPEKIKISGSKSGIFYGLISLLQMLPINFEESVTIPCYNISDSPRFLWRGMHLDVSRHFFPKEFILRHIDFLAYYKMNTFHWHLTDDQGWRIEIKKYPALTTQGAWRTGTLIGHSSSDPSIIDTLKHGGFYTQEEVREIVAYAQARHITVVPEIEMPGHSVAAIHAYPFLSCKGQKIPVATTWGVFEDVFCTKDSVFSFLEDVLTEVMELFPSTYIHIGGDECPKVSWKNCPHCQNKMKSENLKNEYELQSYFIKRIEKFLNKHNRKLIGWDEILEGGLAPNAAVMSWQGIEGGMAAAKNGNHAVMTPGSHCYFDHYQGDPSNEPLAIGGYTTLQKTYSYEPIPKNLTPEQEKLILGAQGNVWTEYMKTPEHVEYMIFPRLCALAEVVWSPKESKNYEDFLNRLQTHFLKFDKRGINYAKSIYEIKKEIYFDESQNKIYLKLNQAFAENNIFYKSNNNDFSAYTSPILIDKNQTIKAETRNQEGKVLGKAEQTFSISKISGAKILLKHSPADAYNYGGANTLVDGILGRIPWNGKEWLGFQSNPMIATIDLGKTQNIEKVIIHTLKAEASWIYLPSYVKVEVSKNGKKYQKMGELSTPDIDKQGRIIEINKTTNAIRYIRVTVESAGKIATGKPGAGHNAWLFISEIQAF